MLRPLITGTLAAVLIAFTAGADSGLNILFLSKSSGFEHSVIRQEGGRPSLVDQVLGEVAESIGANLMVTKDASLINRDNLKNYDIVIMYTSGDLTVPGEDGNPPMRESGVQELREWVAGGGGLIGYHSVTDSFRADPDHIATPFTELIGAEFRTHGAQFEGAVRVVDPQHPAMASMPERWVLRDEWYLYRNLNARNIRVLALLEPGEERQRQEMYDVPDYPIIWVRQLGKGRVYHNGLGHREDVWTSPVFQDAIRDAIYWTARLDSKPNWDAVVPADKP